MKFIHQRLLAALLLLVVCSPAMMARLTAAGAFTDAPASLFPLLDRNTRLDMIDYYNSGSATASQNAMQGKSRITVLNPDDIKISMTDASSYQISLLPTGNDTIIAVIQTVATPAHDSHVNFYSRTWQELKGNYFTPPVMSDWLTDSGKKNDGEVSAMVPFMLAEYVYDPATSTLSLTNNLKEFLSPDVYQLVADYLKPSLIYRWDGKQMNKVK